MLPNFLNSAISTPTFRRVPRHFLEVLHIAAIRADQGGGLIAGLAGVLNRVGVRKYFLRAMLIYTSFHPPLRLLRQVLFNIDSECW